MTTKKIEERNEKEIYIQRKKNLLEKEADNFERVVFLKGTKGFYAVVGHSAVILANKIAPELKMRVLLRRDSDYGVKSKEGIITIKNVGYYKEKFKNSVYIEFEKEDDACISFKLKQKISAEEYALLARSKEIKRQKLENEIVKAVPMPKLNMLLTEVLTMTYRFYRKHSDVMSRRFILDTVSEEVRYAHKVFLAICREEHSKQEGLKKIDATLSQLLCDMVQVIALDVWSVEDCSALSLKIVDTKTEIARELKKK